MIVKEEVRGWSILDRSRDVRPGSKPSEKPWYRHLQNFAIDFRKDCPYHRAVSLIPSDPRAIVSLPLPLLAPDGGRHLTKGFSPWCLSILVVPLTSSFALYTCDSFEPEDRRPVAGKLISCPGAIHMGRVRTAQP